MINRRIRCAFIRGGTSNGLFFNISDLPRDRSLWDSIFVSLMGSPDSYGRQLNGMGGGVSSLSKVAIIGPSTHPKADIDYTFGQVAVNQSLVDYSANCGNLSSAAAAFALEEGILKLPDGAASVSVHNTNTQKVFVSHFEVKNGLSVEAGQLAIPGVSGTGAEVRLEYPDPSGAATGTLLPTGNHLDTIHLDSGASYEVSMVDASNAMVFVAADSFGLSGCEKPDEIDNNRALMEALEVIRRHCGVMMGLAENEEAVTIGSPKIALVGKAMTYASLLGEQVLESDYHLSIRIISIGKAHKVVTLTGAMCAAVAAKLEGSVVHRSARSHQILRLGSPSGVLPVEAQLTKVGTENWHVERVTTWRTQRRLMEGTALLPQPMD